MVSWRKSIHKIRHCCPWYWQLFQAFLPPESPRAQSMQGWQRCCVGHRQTRFCTQVWVSEGFHIPWNVETAHKRNKSLGLIVTKGITSNLMVCLGLEALWRITGAQLKGKLSSRNSDDFLLSCKSRFHSTPSGIIDSYIRISLGPQPAW